MTKVYFIRHAESDYNVHNDMERPLTEKGRLAAERVAEFLTNKYIDIIFSSPFIRAIDTLRCFADQCGKSIIINDEFRERKVDNGWIENFEQFTMKQWEDFEYRLSDGECLRDVQKRNIKALEELLHHYPDKNIVIGSHGTALSTIINYYDSNFGYEDFNKIRGLMPWIVIFTFEGLICKEIEKIDIFTAKKF